MGYKKIQQRFTVGELDPKMLGRGDIEQYYSAAETLTNVICLPQGGFRRRKGTRFLQRIKNVSTRKTSDITITCANGGTTSNANDGNNSSLVTTTGAIGTTADYEVVEYAFGTAVTNGAYVDINNIYLSAGTSTGEIFQLQYLTGSAWTKIGEFDLTTTSRTFRFRVPDFISMSKLRVIKTTAQDLGAAVVNIGELNLYVEGSTVSNARLIDFSFNVDQTYMLVLSNENIDIYEDKEYLVSIKATDLTSARLSAINWTQSSDSLIMVHPDFYPKILVRSSAYDKIWTYSNITFTYIPKYDFVPTSSTPSATLTPSATSGVVTLTAGSSVFTSSDVNQIIDGGGGRARIVEYTSGTVVKAVTLIPFYGTSAIASGAWTLEAGYADAWSATYGYPVSCVFFESRLVFGGSKSLPTYLWLSVVDDYFNFDEGSLYDDEAIVRNIQDSQLNAIKQVFVQKTLQIFTTGAEFVSIQSLNDPITPTNIQIKRQTNSGIEGNLRVFENEGRTLFVQRNGKNVISLIYNDLEQGYNNPSISLFSSHLISSPVDVCLRNSSSTDESSLYFIVRSDGGISVGTLYLSQKVGAFSNLTTTGSFKNVGVDNQDIYVVVNRTIDSVSQNYLEIFDENVACDCCYYATGAVNAVVDGLDFLEGKSVEIVADGAQLSNETVTSGLITMDRASTATLFIGIPFTPYVKTLSVEIPSLGSLLGKKKRIVEMYLRLYETSDIIVNVNNRVAFRGFGLAGVGSPLDDPPPSYTGIKKVPCLLGWDYDGSIVITQETPFEMNVLALEMKVKI